MKILIIEDEANIIQVIRLYLEQAGYSVVSASDGIAGLELHAREHPDLVILDLMLPGLEGMEVCRRIRNWANTPILMLTARQGEEDRILGLESGADDYPSVGYFFSKRSQHLTRRHNRSPRRCSRQSESSEADLDYASRSPSHVRYSALGAGAAESDPARTKCCAG